MSNYNQSVEIVLHVDDDLGEEQRNNLASSLRSNDGVYNATFTPNRDHLMLVEYNRIKYKAIDILQKLTSNSVRAELIGPI
jgi:cell division protein FtsX